MALLISKTVTALGGVELSQVYTRLHYKVDYEGTSIDVHTENYVSKDAYLASRENRISVDGIPTYRNFTYDRVSDGTDVLDFIHDELKSILSTDVMADEPLLDPSTGEMQYDPSTGELITESVVSVPKFTFDSSISIVDVD